jgi:hypothetical protein
MNENLVRRVRRIQRDARFPMPITTAITIARYETKPPPAGYEFLERLNDYDSDVTETVDDIEIRVRVVEDDDSRIGDDDCTGTFTDEHSEGCVKNTGGSRNGFEWYLPCNETLHNTFQELRNAGMTKAAAQERYDQIVQMEMDADRSYVGVIVTLSLDGQELAENSLWGIDSLPDANGLPYLIEVAHDLILEGMAQAEKDAPKLAERLRARATSIAEKFPVAE